MTKYIVQFILPVDNPTKNVIITKGQRVHIFQVPLNHPNAHNMGYQDLLEASRLSGLIGIVHKP